jgi:hypothetical protein
MRRDSLSSSGAPGSATLGVREVIDAVSQVAILC